MAPKDRKSSFPVGNVLAKVRSDSFMIGHGRIQAGQSGLIRTTIRRGAIGLRQQSVCRVLEFPQRRLVSPEGIGSGPLSVCEYVKLIGPGFDTPEPLGRGRTSL